MNDLPIFEHDDPIEKESGFKTWGLPISINIVLFFIVYLISYIFI